MNENWATEDERWCEVCQDDDDPAIRSELMPLTVPTPAFPFRVCADCADEWDAMQETEKLIIVGQ